MIKLVAASIVTLVAFATFASESPAPAPTAPASEPTAECCPCPRYEGELFPKQKCCKCHAEACT